MLRQRLSWLPSAARKLKAGHEGASVTSSEKSQSDGGGASKITEH